MKRFFITVLVLTVCFVTVLLICSCDNQSIEEVRGIKREIKQWTHAFGYGESVRYNLDASCSACIAEAMMFIKAYDKSKTDIRCDLYVDKNYKDIVLYYLNQFAIRTDINIVFIDEEYPFGLYVDSKIFRVDKDGEVLSELSLVFNR